MSSDEASSGLPTHRYLVITRTHQTQPYADDALPTDLSSSYIADSDLEDESEDGPMDYPADEGDDDYDDLSRDDADVKDEEEVTEPFKTDESAVTPPPPAYYTTSRIYVRSQVPITFPSEAKVDKLLALPTPPPSPLTLLSSLLSQIPPLPTSPTYAQASLCYRAAGMRAASPPTHHPLPLPSPRLPPPSSPLILPSTNHRADIPEAVLPPQ
ncbi:hypothetical protein Tco_1544924, partial [Tanacetum coccineum]